MPLAKFNVANVEVGINCEGPWIFNIYSLANLESHNACVAKDLINVFI